MQITSRFTIAVHMLTAIDCFKEPEKRTSSFLAGSIGVNPVIVRNVMGQLKEAGLISSSQGRSGMSLKKDLKDITFYDVYKAIDVYKRQFVSCAGVYGDIAACCVAYGLDSGTGKDYL